MNTTGRDGEETARAYLQAQGYRILARNYRCRRGEVDVIALKDDTVVCAEVKTWKRIPMEGLEHSVSLRKRHAIVTASKRFLGEHPEFEKCYLRYDVLFVEPAVGSLRHFEDAFQETGAL